MPSEIFPLRYREVAALTLLCGHAGIVPLSAKRGGDDDWDVTLRYRWPAGGERCPRPDIVPGTPSMVREASLSLAVARELRHLGGVLNLDQPYTPGKNPQRDAVRRREILDNISYVLGSPITPERFMSRNVAAYAARFHCRVLPVFSFKQNSFSPVEDAGLIVGPSPNWFMTWYNQGSGGSFHSPAPKSLLRLHQAAAHGRHLFFAGSARSLAARFCHLMEVRLPHPDPEWKVWLRASPRGDEAVPFVWLRVGRFADQTVTLPPDARKIAWAVFDGSMPREAFLDLCQDADLFPKH